MKKILSIAFGLVLVLGLTGCEKEIPAKNGYYEKLAQECQQKSSPNCCLASLEGMKRDNAREIPKNGVCNDGYKREMMTCIDSFVWCKKIKESNTNIVTKGSVNNKIPQNCVNWFDGCNNCKVMPDGGLACTQMACFKKKEAYCTKFKKENPTKIKSCTKEYRPVCGQPPVPECLKKMLCKMATPLPKTYANKCMMENDGAKFLYKGKCEDKIPRNSKIPSNCISWFDGCNTCDLKNGKIIGETCTESICVEMKKSKCLKFQEEVKQACPANFPPPSFCGIDSKIIPIKKDENGCVIKYGCEKNEDIGNCSNYNYSTCPTNCKKKCLSSMCSEPDENGNVMCTSDCDGQGSCVEK